MKRTENIRRIIALATAIRRHWNEEAPKHFRSFPVSWGEEPSLPDPPQREELRALLIGLSPAATYLLLSIIYIGRGDFGTDNLLAFCEELSDTFSKPAWAAQQMLGKAPLGDYLAGGVAELTAAGIDVDSLLEP
jgi:hypothetical protein